MTVSINPDEIFQQFNHEELVSNLFTETYIDLRRRNQAVIGKNIMYNKDNPLQSLLGLITFDNFPITTANDIAESVSYLMMSHYMNLRLNNDKNHCDTIIDVQNNILKLANDVVNEGIENIAERIAECKDEKNHYKPLEQFCSGYEGFCKYVAEDLTQYLDLLANVTHTALTKIHPMCKEELDINLDALIKKYCAQESLFDAGIKNASDIKNSNQTKLEKIVGKKTADGLR